MVSHKRNRQKIVSNITIFIGRAADLAVIQKTTIDIIDEEDKPRTIITKKGWLFAVCCIRVYSWKVDWKTNVW